MLTVKFVVTECCSPDPLWYLETFLQGLVIQIVAVARAMRHYKPLEEWEVRRADWHLTRWPWPVTPPAADA